ncbi:peptide-methionine (S)-S-oxide reductase [Pseudokineococcus lusitanus]|uniref:Peptide methionine sulfoxide reductase MsrA n=2 Tax=Pseudokineococcus lusitanus TaxID=763993 RepID=A0A3N1HNA9_9ACTN|nr:peptide-methionine (S)-S-oxide reductase MsrA [Pseudokineococcus lusitanus]ROP44007.1 peptide-methionine (S)-S-oxide reductase [Pseudokineococcus lusitanus]
MALFGTRLKTTMVSAEEALPGRDHRPHHVPTTHAVLGTPLEGPWPEGTQRLYVGMGCFWGAERLFWTMPGVVTTAVGYMGGHTPHPTYEETCTARTGHTETVMVAYDPRVTSAEALLKTFWEEHDPTTANRQGNDVGTQYRSAVYWTTPEQGEAVRATRDAFAAELERFRLGPITTELRPADEVGPFYYAEDYHQQYLHKVPNGYCGLAGTGVACPAGVLPADGAQAAPAAG